MIAPRIDEKDRRRRKENKWQTAFVSMRKKYHSTTETKLKNELDHDIFLRREKVRSMRKLLAKKERMGVDFIYCCSTATTIFIP